MMKIALIVDNPYRDLPGLVLVALRLCQRGVKCFLVPINLFHECWSLAPDFVLLPYLRTNNQEGARQLLDAGIQVGVLDTEGGVLETFETYAQMLAPDPDVRRRVACYCSWGTVLAEHSRRMRWFGEGRVVVTGMPRFDFYAPPWRQAALEVSPYANAFPRPLVLVNGNFSMANPRFQSPEVEARSLVEQFGYASDCVANWLKVQRQTMLELISLTNRLAGRFPRVAFVYRPHPFENLEAYHDLLDKRDNLHLVKKGTVDGWILRASAVIQRSCTTAIEAAMAGVPALLPAWIPTALNMPAAEEVSAQCSTEEELVQTLASVLEGRYQTPGPIRDRLDQVVRDWFCRIDGRAHERVADCILRNLPTSGCRQRWRGCRDLVYGLNGARVSWKRRSYVALKSALGLSPRWELWRRNGAGQEVSWRFRADKFFDAREVSRLLDAISTGGPAGLAGPPGGVGVAASQQRGDFYFGYKRGQSVTLFPQKAKVGG